MGFGYKVYFTERAKNRVICWDPDAGAARVIAGEGVTGAAQDQKLHDPYGISVDRQGHLLIADKLNHRILRLTNRLTAMQTKDVESRRGQRLGLGKDSPFCPTAIVPSANGGYIAAFSDDYTIYRIHDDGRLELLLGVPPLTGAVFGSFQEKIPQEQINKVPLRLPTALVERKDGVIYFIERGYQVVREYRPGRGISCLFPWNPHGVFQGSMGEFPARQNLNDYHPAFPAGLALDGAGQLFLSDVRQKAVWFVNQAQGTVEKIYQTQTASKSTGGPSAINFGPDGTLWVLDHGEGKINGLRPAPGLWQRTASRCSTLVEGERCTNEEGSGICCL